MAVGFTDPDIVLAAHLIQHFTIVRCKDQGSIMLIYGFIFVKADDIFNQCFVKMIFHFVNQQVKPFLQGSNY